MSLRYLLSNFPVPSQVPNFNTMNKQNKEAESIFDVPAEKQDQQDLKIKQISSGKKEIMSSLKDLKENVKDLQEKLKEIENPINIEIKVPREDKKLENGQKHGNGIPKEKLQAIKNTKHKTVANGKHPVGKSNSMNVTLNGSKNTSIKKDSGPKIYLSIKYNTKTSVVSLIVHRVVNLQEINNNKNLPNPYVKTYILENLWSSLKRDVHTKKKTKTKRRTNNPVFEDTLEYFVPANDLQFHKIEVLIQVLI